jgi:hypothetical protein
MTARRPLRAWSGVLGALLLVAGCGPRSEPPARLPPSPRATPPLAPPGPREDGRLPLDVIPTRHHLELTVDPAESTFFGRVEIGVETDKPTSDA